MRDANTVVERLVHAANAAVTGLLTVPWLGDRIGRSTTVITYTGRRSGQVFQTPVSYRETDAGISIGVQFPDAKNWWRNFTGEGGPIAIRLHGTDRTGHAVARRETPRRATVTIALDTATTSSTPPAADAD